MRLADHPAAVRADGQYAVNMGGVTVQAVTVRRIRFVGGWLRVAGTRGGELRAMEVLRAELIRHRLRGKTSQRNSSDSTVSVIGQRIDTDEPGAATTPGFGADGNCLQSQRSGSGGPAAQRRVGAETCPARSCQRLPYHPAAFLSMLSATTTRNPANTRFSGVASMPCASFTP